MLCFINFWHWWTYLNNNKLFFFILKASFTTFMVQSPPCQCHPVNSHEQYIYIIIFMYMNVQRKCSNGNIKSLGGRETESQQGVFLISCRFIERQPARKKWRLKFEQESLLKGMVYQLCSKVSMNRATRKVCSLSLTEVSTQEEKYAAATRHRGINSSPNYGRLQIMSQSINVGGHSNSSLCHSRTWNGNLSPRFLGGDFLRSPLICRKNMF